MLIALTGAKAAPGVTTAAWAFALTWSRPVLVADCDPAGGDMVPGLLAGRGPVDRGLLSWIVTTRRATPAEAAVAFRSHVVGVPEARDLWLLPGLQDATQSPVLDVASWKRLANAFSAAPVTVGLDILVDTGRLNSDSCWPVLRAADMTVLVVRSTLRSTHATVAAAAQLRSELGDLTRVRVLVVGSGPYSPAEVTAAVGAPLLGVLPDDRDAARVLSDGGREGVRGLHRSRLLRAASTIGGQMRAVTPPVSVGATA